MDILSILSREALDTYSRNYDYNTRYLGDAIFTKEKTDNLHVRVQQLVKGGNIPAIAKVSAFDAEAPIGSREKFEEKDYKKLLIKEKLPTSENVAYLLNARTSESNLIKHVFDDPAIETQRVLSRVELANMEVIADAKLTIKENNVDEVVDYGLDATHRVSFSSWSDPTHDVVADLEGLVAAAKKDGYTITRAVTSSKIIGYLTHNEAIVDTLASLNRLATRKNVLEYLLEQFGIDFVTNDDVYKAEGGDSTTHRFFPENKISFMGDGEFGKGLFAPTPDEVARVMDNAAEVDLRQYVYLKAWTEHDPAITWTMGSAVYLPLPLDINSLFIATVTA